MLSSRGTSTGLRLLPKLLRNQKRFAGADHKFGKDFTLKGYAKPLIEIYTKFTLFSQHKTFLPMCIVFAIGYQFVDAQDRQIFGEEFSQFYNKTRLYGKHDYHKGEKYKHSQFPWLEDEQGGVYADKYDG